MFHLLAKGDVTLSKCHGTVTPLQPVKTRCGSSVYFLKRQIKICRNERMDVRTTVELSVLKGATDCPRFGDTQLPIHFPLNERVGFSVDLCFPGSPVIKKHHLPTAWRCRYIPHRLVSLLVLIHFCFWFDHWQFCSVFSTWLTIFCCFDQSWLYLHCDCTTCAETKLLCYANLPLYWLFISFLFFIFLHAFFKSSTNLMVLYCNPLGPTLFSPTTSTTTTPPPPTTTTSCNLVQSKCTMNPLCPPMTTGLVNLSGCSSNQPKIPKFCCYKPYVCNIYM